MLRELRGQQILAAVVVVAVIKGGVSRVLLAVLA
jgi:hypothetical protein